jgi:archaellum component FlaG (FlaF/FlaG flagellin family)
MGAVLTRGMTGLALLTSVLLVGCSHRPAESALPEKPSTTTQQRTATMGTPVHDDGMTFVVNGIRLAPSISSNARRLTADGRYVIVWLTVTNSGDDHLSYDAGSQQLVVDGRRYRYAIEPTTMLGRNPTAQLDPGVRIDAYVAYDIPDGARPSGIELHAAPGTVGAEVNLSAA